MNLYSIIVHQTNTTAVNQPAATPTLTHLLLTDEQLISLQDHESVLPNLPEDSFTAELSDPADLIGLNLLLGGVLRALKQEAGSCQWNWFSAGMNTHLCTKQVNPGPLKLSGLCLLPSKPR